MGRPPARHRESFDAEGTARLGLIVVGQLQSADRHELEINVA
jgi:hypothetical protein